MAESVDKKTQSRGSAHPRAHPSFKTVSPVFCWTSLWKAGLVLASILVASILCRNLATTTTPTAIAQRRLVGPLLAEVVPATDVPEEESAHDEELDLKSAITSKTMGEPRASAARKQKQQRSFVDRASSAALRRLASISIDQPYAGTSVYEGESFVVTWTSSGLSNSYVGECGW